MGAVGSVGEWPVRGTVAPAPGDKLHLRSTAASGAFAKAGRLDNKFLQRIQRGRQRSFQSAATLLLIDVDAVQRNVLLIVACAVDLRTFVAIKLAGLVGQRYARVQR